MIAGKSPATVHGGVMTIQHPMLQIGAMAATYLATLVAAWVFFPLLWHRSFLDGVQWHWATARSQARRLVTLGLALGVMVAIVTSFISPPKSMPIDEFFASAATAWVITLFGTIAAPVFEEICFRGFLLPAIAIAYDWISLPRTDEARTRWQTTHDADAGGVDLFGGADQPGLCWHACAAGGTSMGGAAGAVLGVAGADIRAGEDAVGGRVGDGACYV